jgi:hypothetical protein
MHGAKVIQVSATPRQGNLTFVAADAHHAKAVWSVEGNDLLHEATDPSYSAILGRFELTLKPLHLLG